MVGCGQFFRVAICKKGYIPVAAFRGTVALGQEQLSGLMHRGCSVLLEKRPKETPERKNISGFLRKEFVVAYAGSEYIH